MSTTKVRLRPESFADHYSQARLFFRSVTQQEQSHIVEALAFELSKVGIVKIAGACFVMLPSSTRTWVNKWLKSWRWWERRSQSRLPSHPWISIKARRCICLAEVSAHPERAEVEVFL